MEDAQVHNITRLMKDDQPDGGDLLIWVVLGYKVSLFVNHL